MKTIKEALQRADQLSITKVLEEILLAYTEDQLDSLDKGLVQEILINNELAVPGLTETIPYGG